VGAPLSARRPSGSALARALLEWFDQSRRPLPWRADRDPYKIWVAEVLLQQTRVAAVVPRFESFVRRFPDVRALAAAHEEGVLKEWEGAGYYARARHLHQTAVELVRDHGAKLPRSAAELAELPGIGPYVSAAIASLAFDEPVVALEANGLRVVARWTLETGDVRSPRVRARLRERLELELPRKRPGAFNEAVMELGETVCLPRSPDCPNCPVAPFCLARRELPDPGSIPRRAPRPRRPHVVAAIVALRSGPRWLVRRRPTDGLLGGLWELPGGHVEPGETPAVAARRELREETGLSSGPLESLGVVRHAYSHFTVELHLFRGNVVGPTTPRGDAPLRWVRRSEMARLPRPAATVRAMALVESWEGGASRGSGSRPGRRALSSRAGAERPRRPARPRLLRA